MQARIRAFADITRQARQIAGGLLFTVAVAIPGFCQLSDPPGFAPVPLRGSQVIGLNVFCFEHEVGAAAPEPCRGELMFHDATGRELKRGAYELQPGEAMALRLAIPAVNAAGERIGRVLIIPCLIPGPGGRAIPSVEVLDREAGHAVLFANPAAARVSEFGTSPGSAAGFDPQPDPPGFGMVTLASDQTIRMNVFCFEHTVNGLPPGPCRGIAMFHDARGNVLRRAQYTIEAGRSDSLGFSLPARSGLSAAGIIPCILPAPGGLATANVDVAATASGVVSLVINPAVSRMSQLQKVEQPR